MTADIAPQQASATPSGAPRPAPRVWWIAVLYCLLSPASAYLYVGRPVRSAAAAILTALYIYLSYYDPTGYAATGPGYLLIFGGTAVVVVAMAIDAAWASRRAQGYRRRWWNHMLVYLAVGVALIAGAEAPHLLDWRREQGPRKYHSDTNSMAPTISAKDYWTVDRSDAALADVSRGDIIVFTRPGKEAAFVKRAIGLPGDRIKLRDSVVFVNGAPLPQRPDGVVDLGEAADRDGVEASRFIETGPDGREWRILSFRDGDSRDTMREVTVPDGRVFVLGDNRDASVDSRFVNFGMIEQDRVVGVARGVFFSTDFSRIGSQIR